MDVEEGHDKIVAVVIMKLEENDLYMSNQKNASGRFEKLGF